jgi:tetratricopeptide (TPR) repeat protein
MNDISRQLREIGAKRKRREYENALRLCNELLGQYSDAYEILWERAFVYSAMGNIERAIEDLTHVIAVKPEEPCYYHERAHFLIDMRKYSEAVDDLTEVLRLCDVRRSDYYRKTARFVRAYAYLQLGRTNDALADCGYVNGDFSWWIEFALRTKAEILAEIRDPQEKHQRPPSES